MQEKWICRKSGLELLEGIWKLIKQARSSIKCDDDLAIHTTSLEFLIRPEWMCIRFHEVAQTELRLDFTGRLGQQILQIFTK